MGCVQKGNVCALATCFVATCMYDGCLVWVESAVVLCFPRVFNAPIASTVCEGIFFLP